VYIWMVFGRIGTSSSPSAAGGREVICITISSSTY
jgi:hypothetical protein